MSLLIIGDPHLGKSNLGKSVIGTNLNTRIIDQVNLLDWCLERALHHHVTDIALTGDVFEDPKPSTSLVSLFISWLYKCRVHNINVHIIMGNHDLLRSGTSYNSPLDIVESCDIEGIYIYKNINTCIYNGYAVTYAPFRDRKSFLASSNQDALSILKNQIEYEAASIPVTYKKILVGHLAIEGSIPVGDEIDDLANELMCPMNFFEGYDYVWMGHIHKPQVLNKNPHISHIGSMDISDFGEVDQKKNIIIFDLLFSENFIYEEIPTRKLYKIDIDIPEEEDNPTQYVIDKIKKDNLNLEKSIVKVNVNLTSKEKSINKSEIELFLNKNKVFNISSILESKKQDLIKKESNTLNNKMDVNSAIKHYAESYLDNEIKSDFLSIAIDMYKKYQEEEE